MPGGVSDVGLAMMVELTTSYEMKLKLGEKITDGTGAVVSFIYLQSGYRSAHPEMSFHLAASDSNSHI